MQFKYVQQEIQSKRDIASTIERYVNNGWEYVETIVIPDNGAYSYILIAIFRTLA